MNTKRKTWLFKPLVATVVLSAGSLFFSETTAQNVKEQPTVNAKNDLMVDFKGKRDGHLIFDITHNRPDERRMILRIIDKDNHQLYDEAFFKNVATKRVLLSEDDIDKVTFSLLSSKGEVRKTFTVNYEWKETILVKEVY